MSELEIIGGLFAWFGGEAGVLDIGLIERILNRKAEKEISELLEMGVIAEEKGRIFLRKREVNFIDHSLMKIISSWSFESYIASPSRARTIQYGYLVFSPAYWNPVSRLFPSIRGYVLTYCHDVMERMIADLSNYDLTNYSALRTFMIRISLKPTKEFVSSQSEPGKIFDLLKEKKIIMEESFRGQNLVLLINEVLKGGNRKRKG